VRSASRGFAAGATYHRHCSVARLAVDAGRASKLLLLTLLSLLLQFAPAQDEEANS